MPHDSRWGVLHSVVSRDLVHDALRLINAGIGECLRRGQKGLYDGANWLPRLREREQILALRRTLPFDGVLCEPQIVLGFPSPDSTLGTQLHTHLDEEPPWANGRRYKTIVGVALTSWTPDNGGLHVCETDSAFTAVELEPGDAVWMNPDVPHSPGVNLSTDVRCGVYFRWLAEKPSEERFELGRPEVNQHSGTCCGKPIGCTMTHSGCLFLQHPWKRVYVFGDESARERLGRLVHG